MTNGSRGAEVRASNCTAKTCRDLNAPRGVSGRGPRRCGSSQGGGNTLSRGNSGPWPVPAGARCYAARPCRAVGAGASTHAYRCRRFLRVGVPSGCAMTGIPRGLLTVRLRGGRLCKCGRHARLGFIDPGGATPCCWERDYARSLRCRWPLIVRAMSGSPGRCGSHLKPFEWRAVSNSTQFQSSSGCGTAESPSGGS